MKFRIEPYNQSESFAWNEYLAKTKNGVFLFERNYMDYHQHRFEDASLLIFKENKIAALFPANKLHDEVYSHQGLTFGGILYANDTKADEVIEIMKLIYEYYKALGFKTIIYKTIPYIFHHYPSDEDLYALFRVNAKLIRRDIFSVIDLNNPIKFSETKRQLVKKCIEKEIQVKEQNDFSDYWSLLESVLLKYNSEPVHSLNEMYFLKENFNDRIRLFEARLDTQLLAGIIIYDYKNVVHTQYMANSQEGRKIGALDFINHKLITEIFTDRKYYSFGTSNENNGRELNEGLNRQKELIGGRAVAHDFYQIDLK